MEKCQPQNSIVNSTRVPPLWPLRPNTPWNKDQGFRAVNSVGKARVNFWQSVVLFQLKLQQLYSISFRYIVLSCWHPQEIKKNHTLGWIPSWDAFEHHPLDFFQFEQFWKYCNWLVFLAAWYWAINSRDLSHIGFQDKEAPGGKTFVMPTRLYYHNTLYIALILWYIAAITVSL